MRVIWCDAACLLQFGTELDKALPREVGPQQGEQLILFLVHVMANVLYQDGDLGDEVLIGRIEADELLQFPLDDVVFLDRLEHVIVGSSEPPCCRIEHLLFDEGMDRELPDHLIDERTLGLQRVHSRSLKRLEQLFHRPMVRLEDNHGIG